jgi:hypothetical protein
MNVSEARELSYKNKEIESLLNEVNKFIERGAVLGYTDVEWIKLDNDKTKNLSDKDKSLVKMFIFRLKQLGYTIKTKTVLEREEVYKVLSSRGINSLSGNCHRCKPYGPARLWSCTSECMAKSRKEAWQKYSEIRTEIIPFKLTIRISWLDDKSDSSTSWDPDNMYE